MSAYQQLWPLAIVVRFQYTVYDIVLQLVENLDFD